MVGVAVLGPTGHAIETATGGLQAVETAPSNDYDVILMDVHMPSMGGMEATQAIRHLADDQRELWQQGNTNDP